jgi:ubiquitin carboxyl-terminal hydrolase MINDY-3/4
MNCPKSAAQVGITCRSPLGLLLWMGQEDKSAGFRIGSRLKTPVFPIWITIIGDCSGVLFSKNRDLMRDYHAENRYVLDESIYLRLMICNFH